MSTNVSMWWRSYYGKESIDLALNPDWHVQRIGLSGATPMTDEAIRHTLDNPAYGDRLEELARGKKTVCIAVDDLTKPTEAFRTAPIVVEKLLSAGVPADGIYFVISLGTHRALTLPDFRKKLGDSIANRFRIYNHSPYQNNEFIGKTSGGTELHINKMLLEAEFKIAIGMLMPHNLAGFSGGGKIILPGLASIDTVENNHRSALRGLQGRIGVLEGNQIRADIEEAADRVGLDFLINSIHGEDGSTVGLFCGTPRETYKKAFNAAREVYACEVPYQNDIGIFNAFPRDNWFLLSLSSLDVWSTREESRAIVRRSGTIVVINHCSEGAGEHGLHTKGMKHYVKRDEHGTFRQILADRELIFFSPNLNDAVIRDYYSKPVRLFSDWQPLLAYLSQKHGAGSRVSVFPCGTLQMDRAVLD